MKTLKFAEPLPELVLNGKKDTTWRIEDEKELEVDDELSLCDKNGKEFAEARIIWIKETTFQRLTFEDKECHEKFDSEEEMCITYSRYMNKEINSQTKVKVIKFQLINN